MGALSVTAKPSESPSTDAVARRWLVIFAEMFEVDLAQRGKLSGIWCRALSDLPPDVLNRACERSIKTARFFPKPGDIRAHIDQADKAGAELEAETAWHQALEYTRQWYVPGIGRDRRAPALPANIKHAVEAAGGLRFIERCSEDDLTWAKKRFLEDFKRIDELERSGLMLTSNTSRRILRKIAARSDAPKELPSATIEADRGASGLQVLRDVFAEVLGREQPEAVTR